MSQGDLFQSTPKSSPNDVKSVAGNDSSSLESAPLASRMRPRTLEEYAGQEHILAPGKLLRRAIEADRIQSLILYGPPGTGKTTLPHIIALRMQRQLERLRAAGRN